MDRVGTSVSGTPGAANPAARGVDRDRVLDFVKTLALGVVVVAHSIAWDVSRGEPASVLDVRPGIAWATWTAQILPLFFAVGAVANLASWRRSADATTFIRRRILRLSTPALVYCGFWTALLLPLALVFPEAETAGHFLSVLVWFLGTYAAIVVAVPWTSRLASRPLATLGVWLAAIVAVDAVRLSVAPGVGWLNVLLVWGWLHQLGYHLPELRAWSRARLVALAPIPLALALVVAIPGPFSSSLVSISGDPEPSNLSPPSVVVALYGLTQVLLLAAAYPWLARRLSDDRTWRVIGFAASRAIGIYLWHIPWVAIVAATARLLGLDAQPFTAAWWLAHAGGLAVILGMGWTLAGLAGRLDQVLLAWGTARQRHSLPVIAPSVVIPTTLLAVTMTGFGTWWDVAFFGLPASSALNLAVLTLAWWALSADRTPSTNGL